MANLDKLIMDVQLSKGLEEIYYAIDLADSKGEEQAIFTIEQTNGEYVQSIVEHFNSKGYRVVTHRDSVDGWELYLDWSVQGKSKVAEIAVKIKKIFN
jgi:hypothetical protein